jgi:DNA-binding MarR family transcriptional regulator
VGVEREDLGALFAQTTRRLIEAERPILERHGLTMWGYVCLNRLARRSFASQLALADEIRHDKTRLIGVLDALERDGLIARAPDPSDRRARTIAITPVGRELHARAVADIRAMEERLLAPLAPGERRALLAALPKLADGSGGPAGSQSV